MHCVCVFVVRGLSSSLFKFLLSSSTCTSNALTDHRTVLQAKHFPYISYAQIVYTHGLHTSPPLALYVSVHYANYSLELLSLCQFQLILFGLPAPCARTLIKCQNSSACTSIEVKYSGRSW